MKILVAHNYYQQPGGEDQVFRTEADLLEERGHEVVRETIHNDAVKDCSSIEIGMKTMWNHDSYRRFRDLVRRERPAIVHFHNTFPLFSPAVYYASQREGAAVIQTLHNYRLVCPAATLFRDGAICEKCITKTVKFPAVQHACYRDNRLASATTAALTAIHHAAGTWHHQVDAFLAVSSFLAEKVVEGGLPAAKVHIKPNCIHPDPQPGNRQGGYAMFLGRLSPEKGIGTLLEAWRDAGRLMPLKIVGDGPLAAEVAQAAREIPGVEWLGRQDRRQVLETLHNARCLVAPSIWYEGVPMTVLEAMAVGLPIIGSRIGSIARYLDHGRTALLFTPKDAQDLVNQLRVLLADRALEESLSRQTRREFEQHFSGESTYQDLIRLYSKCSPRNHTEVLASASSQESHGKYLR